MSKVNLDQADTFDTRTPLGACQKLEVVNNRGQPKNKLDPMHNAQGNHSHARGSF